MEGFSCGGVGREREQVLRQQRAQCIEGTETPVSLESVSERSDA